MTYTVRFHYGTYKGMRTVNADDEDQAIAKVRQQLRREGALSLVSETYRIVRSGEES